MKSTLFLAGALASSVVTSAFAADVNVTLVGSTAFRNITYDRIESLYDSAPEVTVHSSDTAAKSYKTYSGIASRVTGDSSSRLIVRCNFIGSIEGMQALRSGAPQPTLDPVPGGGTTNAFDQTYSADVTLSDVLPTAAYPAIPTSAFAPAEQIGIVPFCLFKADNPNAAGIVNIDREQFTTLLTAGNFMPASFLGATSATAANDKVYLVGRYNLSGTRVTVERCTGNANAYENLWTTNGQSGASFGWVTTNGFSSGGTVVSVVQAAAAFPTVAIGYAGYSDVAGKANTVILSYNGVPFSLVNVANGSYLLWGYEQLLHMPTLSGVKDTFRQKLSAAIQDPTYQASATYSATNVRLSDMQFSRSVDGGALRPIAGKGASWAAGSLGQ